MNTTNLSVGRDDTDPVDDFQIVNIAATSARQRARQALERSFAGKLRRDLLVRWVDDAMRELADAGLFVEEEA